MQPDAMNTLPQIQPISKIEPISPMEMRTAFGGPLYQMLNPGTRQIVDNLGLRGQGVGGLAAMAFSPVRKAQAPATIVKRIDKLIKKYKRQQNNYERELGNIPYDGPVAERAAQKELQRLMKTRTELKMVLDRNRGFGLVNYTNNALFNQPKVASRMYMTASDKSADAFKKYDETKFSPKGKKEFFASFKKESDYLKPTYTTVKGGLPGTKKMVKKTVTSKEAPYFIYYPDTYKSYAVGAKFNNVEEAIKSINANKVFFEKGFTAQIRKGNPSKLKDTDLIYSDKS